MIIIPLKKDESRKFDGKTLSLPFIIEVAHRFVLVEVKEIKKARNKLVLTWGQKCTKYVKYMKSNTGEWVEYTKAMGECILKELGKITL